ncbi:MAG: hypothetical protein IJB10_01310 [Clostridia bacterium]|nr:hypothetical protein [Clostridia bacterium]
MERLIVKYKDLALGELKYSKGLFVYKVFEENINKAYQEKYPIMLYGVDKNFIEKDLPVSLDDMIPDEGTDIYKQAQISKEDNEFEKLFKIAQLPLYDNGLYVCIE